MDQVRLVDEKRLAAENIAIAVLSETELTKEERRRARRLFKEHNWFIQYVDSIYNCLEQKK